MMQVHGVRDVLTMDVLDELRWFPTLNSVFLWD